MTRDLTFEPREIAVLEQACRQADDIAALDELIAERGRNVRGSKGQMRLNPAIAEVRQARATLNRLLDSLDIPAEGQETGTSTTSRRARKAAQTRWGQQHAGQLQMIEGGHGG